MKAKYDYYRAAHSITDESCYLEMVNGEIVVKGQHAAAILAIADDDAGFVAWQASTGRTAVEAKRAERYRMESDPVYLEAQEQAAISGTPADLTAWLAIKAAIRAEEPYP